MMIELAVSLDVKFKVFVHCTLLEFNIFYLISTIKSYISRLIFEKPLKFTTFTVKLLTSCMKHLTLFFSINRLHVYVYHFSMLFPAYFTTLVNWLWVYCQSHTLSPTNLLYMQLWFNFSLFVKLQQIWWRMDVLCNRIILIHFTCRKAKLINDFPFGCWVH